MHAAESRFLKLVSIEGEHWMWRGAVVNKNAARLSPAFKLDGKVITGRKASFLIFLGEVGDEGFRVYGTCGVDLCVRPEHLSLKHEDEATAAGIQTQKKERQSMPALPCGHALEYGRQYSGGKAGKKCLLCHREYNKKWKQKRAEDRKRNKVYNKKQTPI